MRIEALRTRALRRILRFLTTGLAIAAAVGCGSAYQATYDQEMRNLEADHAAQQKQAQEEAAQRAAAQASALDEVRRYHAVVYFNVETFSWKRGFTSQRIADR